MAEQTAFRNNACPYPIYGQPFAIVYPFRDADGDLVTGATAPDAEISKNADTFADCTNESTEIATGSGVYYLLLTATEMTADVVAIMAKSTSTGMKTTVATLYPRKLPIIRSGTAAGGTASTIILDASASAVDDYYNGCVVVGTLDGNTEIRTITDYVGSSKTASVSPSFITTPDSDDPFVVLLTEVRQVNSVDVAAWLGTAVATPHTAGYPVTTAKVGTGTGELSLTTGGMLVSTLSTAAKAEVNTEALDVLTVDAHLLPVQGNPPAITTLAIMLTYLYKNWLCKKTVTASEWALYNSDETTKDHEATLSDDGTTFTRGEVKTGA